MIKQRQLKFRKIPISKSKMDKNDFEERVYSYQNTPTCAL